MDRLKVSSVKAKGTNVSTNVPVVSVSRRIVIECDSRGQWITDFDIPGGPITRRDFNFIVRSLTAKYHQYARGLMLRKRMGERNARTK